MSQAPPANGKMAPKPVLAAALAHFRTAFTAIGLISGAINILALTGSFFMLQVYDRVLPSRSIPTLLALALLAGTLFLFQGILELIRSRLLGRIGLALDRRLSGQVYSALLLAPLRARSSGDGLQPLRDLDQVRSFMSSVGPTALFDLPWVPLYLAICFLFHFWIGVAALAGAILLCGLTLLTELRTREPTRLAGNHAASRNAFAEASRRNAEVVHAMGFSERIAERWSAINRDYLDAQARASDVTGALGTASRVLRLALQSGVLGIGAYLVIHQEASGGIMIAGSIILSRALAPIELSIAHWKGFVSARQSWGRLKSLLAAFPASAVSVALPQPGSALTVDGISVTPPGERRLVVHDISFMLTKGAGLAIIGPSASGKSSLARALAGVWQPAAGHVRLDGASLDQWDPAERGKHVGYLPQDVQLFDGTIAENIARFETNPPARKIIDAAKAAGVHGLIVGMREGYDTRVGESGSALSSGQRQRIALARALYDNPFLVVLDEPNSNLDADGEAALTEAIKGIRTRGGIAVVVAHRPSALAALDQILVLANGRAQAFGAKDEVLGAMSRPKTGHAPPLKIVPATEAAGAS